MIYAPSGVGSRVGGVLRASSMVMVREERKEVAIVMPCVRASRRYPRAMLWVCADMEGSGSAVEDCINIVERHHGAQCASPLRSQRRRGGRMVYLVFVDGVFGCVRYMAHGIDCSRIGL